MFFKPQKLKNILITGAGSGLGRELALYFSKNNWNVIATMVHEEDAQKLGKEPNIHCFMLDVTCSTSIATAKNEILKSFPTIDVVINNAGIGYRSFVELSEDDKIQQIVAVNWLGVVKMCRAFIPVFRMQKKGLFINISSVAGLVNLPLGSFYHATKKAVESFSECMAYELIDFDIRVCTVQFGNANTNFQANVVKCASCEIESYNVLMQKITSILQKKTNKNKNLLPQIVQKIHAIAENPPKKFQRYTIGFDANLMRILRSKLGYRVFNSIIRKSVFK